MLKVLSPSLLQLQTLLSVFPLEQITPIANEDI